MSPLGPLKANGKPRKLWIIDVESDGTESPTPTNAPAAPPPAPPVQVKTPGHVHSRMQQEVLQLCRDARCDEEKIDAHVWFRVDEILKATTLEQAEELAKKAHMAAVTHFLINRKHPEKQAKAAERLAKMHANKGDDEKAKQQLEKAKKIRAEIRAEALEKKP